MRIFGLTQGALGTVVSTVGVGRLLGYEDGALVAGFVVYYVSAFLLRDKPPAYLTHWTSTWTAHPAMRRYMGGWCESMRKIWLGAGLPPPPGLQSRYDP